MQKNFLIIFLVVFFIGCKKTSQPSNSEFSSSIKTFGSDAGLSLSSMEQTSDGGFIFSGHALPGPGQRDAGFLIKTDSKGNVQWQNFYGDSGVNIFKTAHQTSDGGFIAVGATTSIGNGLSRKDYYSDAWMLKTDAGGKMLWQKTFGSIYEDSFVDVKEMPDHSIFAVGTTQSYNSNFSSYLDEFYIVKTDKNGNNALPHVAFTQNYSCAAKSITVAADGTVAIAGRISSSASPGWDYYPAFIHISGDGLFLISSSFWVIKSVTPIKIIAVADGFVLGMNVIQPSITNAEVFKINPGGDIQWEQSFPGNVDFSNLAGRTDGGFNITGNNFDGDKSARILQLDSNGKIQHIANCPVSSIYSFHPANTSTINAIPTSSGWAIAVVVSPTFVHRNCSFALIFTDQNGKIITNGN